MIAEGSIMRDEKELDKVKRMLKELVTQNTSKTFHNGKERFEDAIIKDIKQLSEEYNIPLDKLIRIVNSMQEIKISMEENFEDEK